MSFDISFLVNPRAVFISAAESKTAILEQIAAQFESVYGVDSGSVFELMQEREALGSTGFGGGAAIPHARLSGVSRPIAVLMRLTAPVDYDAVDDLPVDLVFGLISPQNAGTAHLQALASISRLVRDEEMHDALTAATDSEEIYAILANATDRDVA